MQISKGNISSVKVPGDSQHLGHVITDFFNEPGDRIWHIDAGQGKEEMKSSVKSRSIQMARCLRKAGLVPGDVVVVAGVNHLDVHIPFYAGYMNGFPMAGIDPFYKYEEVKVILETVKPKLAICEVHKLADYEKAVKDLRLDTRILTFGESKKSLADFLKMYDDHDPESDFKVANFDTDKVYAWLISTSGTTGLPKVAAIKHSEVLKMLKINSGMRDKEIKPFLNLSSMHWISGYLATFSPIVGNQYNVQTSMPFSVEHMIDIINKYKPAVAVSSPLLFINIMKHEKHCDLTCFKSIFTTGFAMNQDTLQKLKARMRPEARVCNLLGQTECVSSIMRPAPDGPPGNCGVEVPMIPVQLVDHTGEVITEPNKTGELWTKGPRFTEYYNNPQATANAFSPDGWYKTGDLLYRDENGYFFFVERITSSFRYRNYYVTPAEVELVIKQHPGVLDVCVIGVPHPDDGKRAVACVQRCPGSTITEKDVIDLVAGKLSFHKQLHGGVIFMEVLPRTISGKIARGKVYDKAMETRKIYTEYPCSGNTRKLISTFRQLSEEHTRNVSTGTH